MCQMIVDLPEIVNNEMFYLYGGIWACKESLALLSNFKTLAAFGSYDNQNLKIKPHEFQHKQTLSILVFVIFPKYPLRFERYFNKHSEDLLYLLVKSKNI